MWKKWSTLWHVPDLLNSYSCNITLFRPSNAQTLKSPGPKGPMVLVVILIHCGLWYSKIIEFPVQYPSVLKMTLLVPCGLNCPSPNPCEFMKSKSFVEYLSRPIQGRRHEVGGTDSEAPKSTYTKFNFSSDFVTLFWESTNAKKYVSRKSYWNILIPNFWGTSSVDFSSGGRPPPQSPCFRRPWA